MRRRALLFLAGAMAGCNVLSGVSDLDFGASSGAGAAGSGAGSSSQSGSGVGAGGTAATGGGPCSPGETSDCYSGPAGTQGVGPCLGGTTTCGDDAAWGPCAGEVTPAAEACATIGDEDCDGVPCSEPVWARRYGSGGDQTARAVAVDPQGNVLVVGGFGGAMTVGATLLNAKGDSDVFLLELDPAGNPLWAESFGDGGNQRARGVAIDASGAMVIVGDYENKIDLGGPQLDNQGAIDGFVGKLDASGNHLWSVRLSGAGDQYLLDAVILAGGDVVVSGALADTAALGSEGLTSNGSFDVVVARLDGGTGATVWAKTFGSGGLDYARDVAIDAGGAVVLAGTYSGAIGFGGPALDHQGTNEASFVVKLDAADGGHVWSRGLVSSGQVIARGVDVDARNRIAITGELAGDADFGGGPLQSAGLDDVFVVVLDADGEHLWSKRYGDAADQYGCSVAFDATGALTVGVRVQGSADFGGGGLTSATGYAIAVAKLDGDGAHLWSKLFGPSGDVENGLGDPVELAITPGTLEPVLAAYTTPEIDLGTGILPAGSGHDVVVAKFAP